MTDAFHPIAGDPAAPLILEMFDASAEWFLASDGDYQTAAVETMLRDGSSWQRLVALEFPVRRNHAAEAETLRLLISPDDAAGLAEALMDTVTWLAINNPGETPK